MRLPVRAVVLRPTYAVIASNSTLTLYLFSANQLINPSSLMVPTHSNLWGTATAFAKAMIMVGDPMTNHNGGTVSWYQ